MLKRVITTTGPMYVNPDEVTAIFTPGGGSGLIENYCMMAVGQSHFRIAGTVEEAFAQLTDASEEFDAQCDRYDEFGSDKV